MFLVEKMHRSAKPARTAGSFAEKFCHAGVRARPARQRMGMIAIRGDNVIIGPSGRDRPGHDRFLTDIEMTKAADFLCLILLAGALLKTPDQQHRREHLDFVALLRPAACEIRRQRASRGGAAARLSAGRTHADDKKQREKQVAHKRVAEKHPSRRRAVLRQTNSQRLDKAGKIFHVSRIGQPGKRVGDSVKNH